MSGEGLAAAQEVDGTPLDKFLAVTLGLGADEDGIAWPSQETLAQRCGVTIRAINRSLGRLEAAGFLQIVNVKIAIEVHKELMGGKKPRREFAAWCKGADKRSVCYVLNLGRFRWRDPKQQDSRSINFGDPESPIVGQVIDSNDQTNGLRVHLINNKNKNNKNADDVSAPSPVGSAGDGQPPGAEAEKPKLPAANAVWKANARAVFDAFMFNVFEKVIEPLTVLSDADGVLTLGCLHDNHAEWFEQAKGLSGRPAKAVLQEVLGRQIEVRVWSEVAPSARERVAVERRAKRLGVRPRKDHAA